MGFVRLLLRRIFVFVYVSCLVIASMWPTKALSADSVWMGAVSPSIVLGPQALTGTHFGNTDCENTNIVTAKVSRFVRTTPMSVTIDSANISKLADSNACVLENNVGGFSPNGYYTGKGLDYAFRVTFGYNNNATYSLATIPSGNGVAVVRPSSRLGQNIEIINDFRAVAGLDVAGTVNELVMHVDPDKEPDQLRYSGGSLVDVKAYAFSRNGRYMVLELPGRGLVRLRLSDMTLTPFAPSQSYNGTSFDPVYYLAISDDGRYVAKDGKWSAAGATVYDLSQCANITQTFPQTAASGSLAMSGCVSKDISSVVGAGAGNTNGLTTIRFLPAGTTIEAYNWYAGASDMRRITIVAAGTQYVQDGYLGMGDSFASGEGDNQGYLYYEYGTDSHDPTNLCHLSRRSYPYLLANQLGYSPTTDTPSENGRFHSIACSGAEAKHVLQDPQRSFVDNESLGAWLPGYQRQADFIKGSLSPVRSSFYPSVITISMGGNDVGFSDVIRSCIAPGTCDEANDPAARSSLGAKIIKEKAKLTNLYKTLKKTAPNAKIYVVGYPIIASTIGSCANNVRLDPKEIELFQEATKYMNQIIKSATQAVGVTYVDVEDMLLATALCSGKPDNQITVNGLTYGDDVTSTELKLATVGGCIDECIGNESYHPNQLGHQLYASRIRTATNDFAATNPAGQDNVPLPMSPAYFGTELQNAINSVNAGNTNGYLLTGEAAPIAQMGAGYKEVSVSDSGYQPNSTAEVSIQSTPLMLGTIGVNANGDISGSVTIPSTIPAGYHHIHIKGKNILGKVVDHYQGIYVAGSAEDVDGDGIPNPTDPCLFVNASGQDIDEDSVDDACDADLATPITKALPAPSIQTIGGAPAVDLMGSGSYLNQQSVRVTGAGVPDALVSVTNSGFELCTANVAADGLWSCDLNSLVDGQYDLIVTQKSGQRVPSVPSNHALFTIDTARPASPRLTKIAEDVYPNGDAVTAEAMPIIEGTGEAGAWITVMDRVAGSLQAGQDRLCNTEVEVTGVWTCAVRSRLTDGDHELTVYQTDKAGNVSELLVQNLRVTAIPLGAPVILSVNGSALTDILTNNPTPILSGGAVQGASVTVRDALGVILCSVIADLASSWTCKLSSLSEGVYAITATQKNEERSDSAPSNTLNIRIDTTPPDAPVVQSFAEDLYPSSFDTSEQKPLIKGFGDVGSTITIKEGNNVMCSTVVLTDGTWECSVQTPLIEGVHTFVLILVDQAGNKSAELLVGVKITPAATEDPLLKSLYRARWGIEHRSYVEVDKNGRRKVHHLEEDGDKIYIERNIAVAKAAFGISDYDPDGDGWAIVGVSREIEGKNREMRKFWVTKTPLVSYKAYQPHVSYVSKKSQCSQLTPLNLERVDRASSWWRPMLIETPVQEACTP